MRLRNLMLSWAILLFLALAHAQVTDTRFYRDFSVGNIAHVPGNVGTRDYLKTRFWLPTDRLLNRFPLNNQNLLMINNIVNDELAEFPSLSEREFTVFVVYRLYGPQHSDHGVYFQRFGSGWSGNADCKGSPTNRLRTGALNEEELRLHGANFFEQFRSATYDPCPTGAVDPFNAFFSHLSGSGHPRLMDMASWVTDFSSVPSEYNNPRRVSITVYVRSYCLFSSISRRSSNPACRSPRDRIPRVNFQRHDAEVMLVRYRSSAGPSGLLEFR